MSKIEASYPARVDEIQRRMKERGLSPKRLAKVAAVSDKTLDRLLKERRKGHLATYAKLAKALKVDDVSTLYVDTDPPQENIRPPHPVAVDLKLNANAREFDETDDLHRFIENLISTAGLRAPVRVIALILGSIIVRLEVDFEGDVDRLLRSFLYGHLKPFGVTELTIHEVSPDVLRHVRGEETRRSITEEKDLMNLPDSTESPSGGTGFIDIKVDLEGPTTADPTKRRKSSE